MKRCCLFWVGWFLVFAGNLWAQRNFVYTNNDTIPNTVSGFAVGEDGVLTEVPGSPFLTGGNGSTVSDFRFFASNRIRVVGNFLYASNFRSNSVSGFSIDPDTGRLTPVPGSPFPTGGRAGISLAVTPDGRFLYAGHDGSEDITVFGVGLEGELTRIGDRVPAGGSGVNGMMVSPDGRWLAVVLSGEEPHGAVAIFGIDSGTGELTPVEGSPFLLEDLGGPDGQAAGVDINCASDTLYVGVATFSTTIVDVLSIGPQTGALGRVPGAPFMPGVGIDSNVPLLSPDDSLLFVSNQGDAMGGGYTITVFTVSEDGSLSLVPGSPFPVGRESGLVVGMATDSPGRFLYAAKTIGPVSETDVVAVLSVDSNGALSEVPGSPFQTGQSRGLLYSLAAYPPKSCIPRGSERATHGHKR